MNEVATRQTVATLGNQGVQKASPRKGEVLFNLHALMNMKTKSKTNGEIGADYCSMITGFFGIARKWLSPPGYGIVI